MELFKKFHLFHFKLKYVFRTMFIRQKDNTVLFIQSFQGTVDSIDKNLSNLLYEKEYIDPKNTSKKEQMKKIKKAKYIYCDNYYVYFSEIDTSDKIVVQVWHAGVVLKKIGFDSEEVKKHSIARKKRYQKVYDSFDYYVCASEHVSKMFQKSFNQPESKMLITGYPKLDMFFKNKYRERFVSLRSLDDEKLNKLNILYAPTFRDDLEDNLKQVSFLDKLKNDFGLEYNVYYKFHDKVLEDKKFSKKLNEDFELSLSSEEFDYYLAIADIIITDYSSISLEALLLKKTIIYYAYDYEKYEKERGLNIDIKLLPGYFSTSYEEVSKILTNKKFMKNTLKDLDKDLQPLNPGTSSRVVIDKIMDNKEINMQSRAW